MESDGLVIRTMGIDDYDQAMALWRNSDGVGLSEADGPGPIAAYLERNPGLSFTARRDGVVIGAVLAGHDGRRGFLHHLAVAPSARRSGVGSLLVNACLTQLKKAGIAKCHVMIYVDNDLGTRFWRSLGWFDRDDLKIMSINLD